MTWNNAVDFMSYEEARSYIDDTEKFGNNYGLSRTEKILELLGNPHKKIKCIHVAGTNGKGSTTAMINEMLFKAGYKVGMYTSPYLEEFEERMQINKENISKDNLRKIISKLAKVVNEVIKLGYEHPTEFEIITCAMYLYFYLEKVDYAVIEVGLGGRLDSTNVITPLISVITSISYDHMDILGSTLTEIATEKAGIIKKGIPVVCYPQNEEALEVIKNKCKKEGSELVLIKEDSAKLIEVIEKENSLTQALEISTKKDTYFIELSLLGQHQILNASLAVSVIEELCSIENIEIESNTIIKSLKDVKWPARLEVVKYDKGKVIIDGAHNIDGIMKLKESITTYFKYDKMILILGILADKQVDEMLSVIAPMSKKIITVTPHSKRAELALELKNHVKRYNENCESIEDYKKAYEKALTYASPKDIIVISGSLYMVGDMRKIIKDKHL